MLFVGDILQLPPFNGAPVFDRITNKSVASKLGCMTSVNIWQDIVVYDEYHRPAESAAAVSLAN